MKILRYSLIAVGVFLVVAVGFFFYSVAQLPDPVEIKNKLKEERIGAKPTPPKNEIQKEVFKEAEELSEALAEESGEDVHVQKNTSEEILDLMKEDYQDIRVCENLENISETKLDKDAMEKALGSRYRNDPYLESIRIPLKHIFQSKPVRELFAEIEEVDAEGLKNEEKSDYLKKVGFYAFAINKVREIYKQKSEYEAISDRAYALQLITEIVQKKPELARDKNVLDFCNQMQQSIGSRGKSDITEERKELVSLVEYAGFTPKELNFDPNIRTKFTVDLDNKSIRFNLDHPGKKTQ